MTLEELSHIEWSLDRAVNGMGNPTGDWWIIEGGQPVGYFDSEHQVRFASEAPAMLRLLLRLRAGDTPNPGEIVDLLRRIERYRGPIAEDRTMMYLVVIRHSMDDVPVLLTADKAEADALTDGILPEAVQHHTDRYDELAGIDASTPVCMALLTFDAKGQLMHVRVGKDLDV